VRGNGTVARINIAPVKGTRLVHPTEVKLERFGVPENRRFHLVNGKDRLFSGTRHGPLVALVSSYDPEREWLEVEFPDGSVAAGRADLLGDPVSTVMWGREIPGHVALGPWSEAISRRVGEPVRLIRSDRPGDGVDSHAASIVGTASVAELGRRANRDGPLDARRFRMLVEIDGLEPHEEDTWIGSAVRIGEAAVRVIRPDPRCVVTERDPETGLPDFDTRKAILAYRPSPDRDANFGVYADVIEPGTVAVGDAAHVLEGSVGK
jgi:uncharacterized protein YcbX